MIQLTQCPAWPQSLSGGENMCICQKTHFVTQYSNPLWLLQQTFPRGSVGLCPPFWAATRLHLDFSAKGVQHTIHICKFLEHPQGNWGYPTGIMGHSEWASLAHKVAGSWGTREVVLNLPPTKVFAATGKGGGTVNLQGSQIQQKAMNFGSFSSLSRTDVHQISRGFNLQSWLFHQNSQRA